MKLVGIPYEPRQLYYMVGDVIAALAAIWLAHIQRYGWRSEDAGLFAVFTDNTSASVVFVLSTLLILYVADAYNSTLDFLRPVEIIRLWLAVAVTLFVQVTLYFLFPEQWWGRGIAGLTSLNLGLLLTAWRPVLVWRSPGPPFKLRTLLVGDGEAARILVEAIRNNPEHSRAYDLAGSLDYPRFGHRRNGDPVPTEDDVITQPGVPKLGAISEVRQQVKKHHIQLIVVSIRGGLSSELASQLLECKAHGVQIEEMPTIYKRITGKVPILYLSDSWLIFGPVFSGSSRTSATLQRVMDIVLSLVGLVLSAPFILVAAVAVKLESKGPAFFWQERCGRNERPFDIVKLRTMRNDAEATSGAVWSQGAADPRVTRVGRWLRRARIDELPQFWNVLRGDMAIIGPRPEREYFVRQLKAQIPFYALRFSVKPGVTGWAQVNFRYGASVEEAAEKLCYELFAIQELNPALYGFILLKTVQTMLLRSGS